MSDRYVCSDASVGRGEGTIATASQVRAWLLVEVHGAWGTDAITESHLGAHLPEGWKADLQRRGIRPICIRPADRGDRGDRPDEVRLFFVLAGRPGRNEGRAWARTVPSLGGVRHVSDDLRIGDDPEGWRPHTDRLVLVCTNGKHDQCCANLGRPVVRHLRTTAWASEVWECSHIGGDRFAANVVVLPDSLYFGRMEPPECEAILDAHADGRIALDWYRGRSTLRFAEQAAEHAVRASLGVDGIDAVVIEPTPDADRFRARVQGIGTVDVVIERAIGRVEQPLTCHGSPGQQVPRYTATELIEVPAPDA